MQNAGSLRQAQGRLSTLLRSAQNDSGRRGSNDSGDEGRAGVIECPRSARALGFGFIDGEQVVADGAVLSDALAVAGRVVPSWQRKQPG